MKVAVIVLVALVLIGLFVVIRIKASKEVAPTPVEPFPPAVDANQPPHDNLN